MKKEKLEEEYNFVKNKNNFKTILNNINNFGKLTFTLGQILLFLIIAGSALNYAKTYILDLNYQVDLTFEQFIAFGFSNLILALLFIIGTYVLAEFAWQIKKIKEKNKLIQYILYIAFVTQLILIYIIIFIIFHSKFEKQYIELFYILFTIFIMFNVIILFRANEKNINNIRIIMLFISIFIFTLSKINTFSLSGIGDYNTTIMVDQNSFIKDIVDIEKPLKNGDKEKYTKNYHYKGDHIELKDVKVLSTLGDIAYVELCSENMEINKTLDDCRKSIRVEFVKKDIHIIRDGKKQDIANTEDSSDKTNNENKEQNEQDLEKSKESKKEENTTKNN